VAKLIRQILIDHARGQYTLKRGGDLAKVPFSQILDVAADRHLDQETLLDLDFALGHLEEVDSRQCQVVELRFFVGLTIEQIAEAQQTSRATVKRDWDMAKRWLARELRKKTA
jgi:RNA polymerase sigma factor (TIGR02999 family)